MQKFTIGANLRLEPPQHNPKQFDWFKHTVLKTAYINLNDICKLMTGTGSFQVRIIIVTKNKLRK